MHIIPIQTGVVAVKTAQRRGRGTGLARRLRMFLDTNWTEPLPILAWLIDHPEGPIVVDSGETARTSEGGYFPRWHPYFRFGVREDVAPEDEIGPQLLTMGIDPKSVAKVVLTHFHTDHAGGLSYFIENEVIANAEDYALASGFRGQVRSFLPQHWPNGFQPTLVDEDDMERGGAWESFPGSVALTSDGAVRIVPSPGHTPGHQSVVVDDGRTVYFLAGDTSYDQQLLLERSVDGVSRDDSVALRTIDRIRELARRRPTIYLPSHDPRSIERLERSETMEVNELVAV